jgi:hypothetical protein
MYCQQCGAKLKEGMDLCGVCYTLVRKPGFWQRLAAGIGKWFTPRESGVMMEQVVTAKRIEYADPATGEKRVVHSLEELPPELRAQLEALRNGDPAAAGVVQSGQVTWKWTGAQTGPFNFHDAAGQTRTYQSIAEMPKEVRAMFEQFTPPDVKTLLDALKNSPDSPTEVDTVPSASARLTTDPAAGSPKEK